MLCSGQIGKFERIRVYRGRSWDYSVQLKLENLRELRFIGEEVGIIVQRLPEFLGRPTINCARVSNFLWKNGSFLAIDSSGDFEKRLKPSLSALKTLMMMTKSSKKVESHT